jgi:hypothetical protein
MWLATKITGPVLGTFSLPLMCQRVKSQKNDLTAHLLMKKNSRDTDHLFPKLRNEKIIAQGVRVKQNYDELS